MISANHHSPLLNLDELAEAACRISLEAGAAILRIYRQDFAVEHKRDNSPVTEADLQSHHIIQQGLKTLTPQLPVLTEESQLPDWSQRSQWQRYWLVDPLDGTREFINRNDEFTVNIALIEHNQPIIGVVHAPALGVTYGAICGQGAWRSQDGQKQPIHCRPRLPGQPIRVAISRSHMSEQDCALLEKIGPHQVIRCGSALKSCLIAEGKADFYPRLGPTSEWDTAAAQCVLETAGGFMTDLTMQRLTYNRGENILNPSFFAFAPPWHDWSVYLD